MAEQRLPRNVSPDQFLNQIRAGVFDAMVQLMSGASHPSGAFFSAVRDGVREAVRATVTAGQLRAVPDSALEPSTPAAEREAPP